MALFVKNGTVVNDDAMLRADVLVLDGKIAVVAQNYKVPIEIASLPDYREIDATNKLLLPGGIDPHTHLQLPFRDEVSADDFFTGTRAALAGGTTMIIDFVIPSKTESLINAYRRWRAWADPKVCCDYALTVAVTAWREESAQEMQTLTRPEFGVNSFKFYLAYAELMLTDSEFYQGLCECARVGALARVHAENGTIIRAKQKELLAAGCHGPEGHAQAHPEESEAEATTRACVLGRAANCPLYVVHVMSKPATRVLAHHRLRGSVVFGEAIVAALALTGTPYFDADWRFAAAHVMSPPLSVNQNTRTALLEALACGVLQVVGSDNCTYTCAQKAKGKGDFSRIPSGINGLEDRMSVVWEVGVRSGHLSPMQFVSVTSAMAARIFNMYPRKGRIAVGSDADLVVWNTAASHTISSRTHHHAHDFNVFEGFTVHGVPEVTVCGGKVVWEKGRLDVQAGHGAFVPLAPWSDFVFGAIRTRQTQRQPHIVPRRHCEK